MIQPPPPPEPHTPASCMVGVHDYSAATWQLRPPLVVPRLRVNWLRWERRCGKCKFGADRRWFKVALRNLRGRRAIPVATYLALLKVTPPDPASLPTGYPDELKPDGYPEWAGGRS